VSGSTASFFHNPNSSFNLWNVFVFAGDVHVGPIWHCMNEGLRWCKFSVTKNGGDPKSASKVEDVYLFERFEDGCYLAIHQMFHQGEAYLPAESEEEWYLVDKEDVKCHLDLLVKLEDVLWDSYKVKQQRG